MTLRYSPLRHFRRTRQLLLWLGEATVDFGQLGKKKKRDDVKNAIDRY